MNNDFLYKEFLGNPVFQYLWFAGILIAGVLFHQLLSKFLSTLLFRLVKKYSDGVGYDQFLGLLKKPFAYFVLLITLFFAFDRLNFPEEWHLVTAERFGLRLVLMRLFQTAVASSILWIILRLIDFFGLILSGRAKLTESKTDDMVVPFIKESVKVVVTIIGILTILGSIYDLNVSSIIAGLGIGGLAFALAAKESLENLIGSFTIFLDKPFQVGDVVQFGSTTGTVEKIGFRSTRLRTAEKSFLTVPNKKLVDAELDNLTLRNERRIQFYLTIDFTTNSTDLKKCMIDIQNLLKENNNVSKDFHVKLFEFSNQGIQVLVEYFINRIDYATFLQVKNDVNFRIKELLEENNIQFAQPRETHK